MKQVKNDFSGISKFGISAAEWEAARTRCEEKRKARLRLMRLRDKIKAEGMAWREKRLQEIRDFSGFTAWKKEQEAGR